MLILGNAILLYDRDNWQGTCSRLTVLCSNASILIGDIGCANFLKARHVAMLQVDARDSEGRTALHLAAGCGDGAGGRLGEDGSHILCVCREEYDE